MRYVSTRGGADPVSLSDAVERGLAPDGGLYVPEAYPAIPPEALDGVDSLPGVAERVLAPFFAGDALAPALGDVCREAFAFPVPLRELRDGTAVLELFH
ncbi:MAG: threonine synthase, partial [Longimicrobiaceae bacterium]